MDAGRLRYESQKTVRRPVAKADIVWAGRNADEAVVAVYPLVFGDNNNRVSAPGQVVHGIGAQKKWLFCETVEGAESRSFLVGDDADDADAFCAMPDVSNDLSSAQGFLVGWRGKAVSDDDPNYDGFNGGPQVLTVKFPTMTVSNFILNGDAAMGEFPVAFDVRLKDENGKYISYAEVHVKNNTSVNYRGTFGYSYQNVSSIEFTIQKWNKTGAFVKITAAYDNFTAEIDGSDIVKLSILEETDGAVGTLPFGSVSANEMDISLQNVDDKYFRGNIKSDYNNLARAGRRIEPFIGFMTDEGEKLYAPKGVYWTGDWTIPETGTTASTTARDRLGLLQDVEYNGLGSFNVVDDKAKMSYWENENLYNIAVAVLTDLRDSYGPMAGLELDIDGGLGGVIIPLAFFERQSYFDVIRLIAEAGSAYAYMDTPTDEEAAAAALRGNLDCVDILRIRRIENYWQTDTAGRAVEELTKRDYTDKTPTLRRDDVVNLVSVPYQEYAIGDDGAPEAAGDEMVITQGARSSMIEYGSREFTLPVNTLVQTRDQARVLADGILNIFSGAPITAEINSFGDVTRGIGDIILAPEYQKGNINKRGYYAVTRIHTEFGDGLRQTLTCRRLGDG